MIVENQYKLTGGSGNVIENKSSFSQNFTNNRTFENHNIKGVEHNSTPFIDKNWDGRTRTSEMAGPKPAALPLGDIPLGMFLF